MGEHSTATPRTAVRSRDKQRRMNRNAELQSRSHDIRLRRNEVVRRLTIVNERDARGICDSASNSTLASHPNRARLVDSDNEWPRTRVTPTAAENTRAF